MTKLIVILMTLISFSSCGKSPAPNSKSSAGITVEGCTVQSATNGAIIHCGNTEGVVFNGTNGYNALVQQGLVDTSVCPAGGYIFNMGDDTNRDGLLNYNEVTSSAVVCNGTNAPATPFSPVGLLAPCAADPMHPTAIELSNPDLEVFLSLSNGTVLDSYSETISGYNTHFGVLSPGTYISTGAGNCTFTYSNGVVSKN